MEIFNLGSTSQGKGLVAADLVRLDVDVIVGFGTLPPLAAMQATTTIPIVMAAAGDPVGSGLVVSLARPGGNVMADVRGTKGPRRSLPGAFSCRRPGLFRPHHVVASAYPTSRLHRAVPSDKSRVPAIGRFVAA